MEPKKLLQEVARWCRGKAPYSDEVASVIGPTEDPWKLISELSEALAGYVRRDLVCEDPERKSRAEALVGLLVKADSVSRNTGNPKSSGLPLSPSEEPLEGDLLENELLMFPDIGDR